MTDNEHRRDADRLMRERTIGCSPGETPAGIVMAHQELRHREALATRDAEIERLKAERCQHGWKGSVPESAPVIKTPCPACGLKSLFIGSGGHLTCANLSCKEPSPESTWTAERALREKRERQLVWAFRHSPEMAGDSDVGFWYEMPGHGQCWKTVDYTGDDFIAGLLAAIDEVCP